MRVLAIDYGRRRVGLALSDPGGIVASPLEVLDRRERKDWFAVILQRIVDLQVVHLVVGLPRNMDGTYGEAAQACQKFADELKERSGLPVSMIDERLTSTAAHASLREGGTRAKDAKGRVDAVAASLLLQIFLSRIHSLPSEGPPA